MAAPFGEKQLLEARQACIERMTPGVDEPGHLAACEAQEPNAREIVRLL
jgi:hypothetical protein